ncbi:hypothetical protein C8F01DRAFT_776469 [Mycena amicta]|nr:hypothetical protein C8F01DRAFT_776469 [Mycena amicta]
MLVVPGHDWGPPYLSSSQSRLQLCSKFSLGASSCLRRLPVKVYAARHEPADRGKLSMTQGINSEPLYSVEQTYFQRTLPLPFTMDHTETDPLITSTGLAASMAAARANRARRISLLLAIVVASLLEITLFARLFVFYAHGSDYSKDIAFYVIGPAALTASVTVLVIIALFRAGKRRPTNSIRRVPVQILILVVYAASWAIAAGLMWYVPGECPSGEGQKGWAIACGSLFSTALVLNSALVGLLLIGARATYLQAACIHGTELVRNPEVQMIAAWRLADVEDGAVKI